MKKIILSVFVLSLTILTSCGDKAKKESGDQPEVKQEAKEDVAVDPMQNKGIGPVKSVTLAAEVNQELAEEGKKIYDIQDRCSESRVVCNCFYLF